MKTTRLGQKRRDARKANSRMTTENHLILVNIIKNRLVEAGQTFTTNCDAFAITARVAWQLRAQGAMLIRKTPAQNGCEWQGQKYSHDAIAFPDGWVDVLVSAGPPANLNRPVWQWTPGGPPHPDTVAAPFDLDAGSAPPPVDPQAPDPPVHDPPGPDLPTLTELAVAVTLLAETVKGLREDLGKLNDVLELDMQSLGTSLVRIEETQRRGVGGRIIGYQVRLVP